MANNVTNRYVVSIDKPLTLTCCAVMLATTIFTGIAQVQYAKAGLEVKMAKKAAKKSSKK